MSQKTQAQNFFQRLLADERIMEVMVNRYDRIFVDGDDVMRQVDSPFTDADELIAALDDLLAPIHRRVRESGLIFDSYLPGDARMHIVMPPIAADGPAVTIRKRNANDLTLEQVIAFGSLSADMAGLLRLLVEARQNVLIAGGPGSGKTTVANIVTRLIPTDERIVGIKDVKENAISLLLTHPNAITLETQPSQQIDAHMLMQSAVKMRPDRIIMGPVMGAEAWDMIEAMNTGYDGSMMFLHATSPADALTRLEIMITQTNPAIPLRTIRQQIASALNVVIQVDRLPNGKRRMTHIMEVAGMRGEFIEMHSLYTYRDEGQFEAGTISRTLVDKLESVPAGLRVTG